MAKMNRFQPLSIAEEKQREKEAREQDDGVRIIMEDEDDYDNQIDVLRARVCQLENQAVMRERRHIQELKAQAKVYQAKIDSKEACLLEILEQKRKLRNELDKCYQSNKR